PSWGNHDVVTLLERGFLDRPADPAYHPSDFMAGRDRARDIRVLSEVAIHELDVGAAHAASLDLYQYLVRLDFGNWTLRRIR
ncbi:hypothetical protein, partial [Rhizobium leguminosarum]|uniref:hypothetical protein n=1 Tax=Rhizobium leguminosarum TaxID=384 RepID=UPI003F945E75